MKCLFDKSGDLADLSGADDEVDKRVFLFDFFGPELSHTSGDTDDDFGVFLLDYIELANERESFIFRFTTHATGVEEDYLGFSP